jgi:hypothetical protein
MNANMISYPAPTTLELDRNWIFGGYSCEFSITLNLNPALASAALDIVAHTLYAHLSDANCPNEIKNIKGRDPHEAPLLNGAPALTGEELFSVGGRIAIDSGAEGFIWEPFHYSCHTRFSHFEGARAIVHSIHSSRSETIPDWLPWRLLGAAAPIEPTYFRLGLELFSSRFVITRLSFTPVVTETFLIDLVGTTVSIKLRTEQPYWKPCNPFVNIAILRKLAAELTPLTGRSIGDIFQRELNARAGFT